MTSTLHVTNGDSTVQTLAELGIDALPWRDALHEGPVVPGGRALRALAMGASEEEFEARDRRLDEHDGPLELWFEADLYDQLQLVEILARTRASEITLRQIGEHVGIAHFGGLGELTAPQLAAIPAITLTDDARDLARRAWDALTAPEPHGLTELPESRELRFVREAFVRLAQEHPWRRDGLALSERRLLAATPGTREQLFGRAWAKEIRPFMGDTLAFRALERLAPLLDEDARGVLRLNPLGRRVLEGEATFITDRWVGGVHVDTRVLWRWDDVRERLV
jgi:hypothetical protein